MIRLCILVVLGSSWLSAAVADYDGVVCRFENRPAAVVCNVPERNKQIFSFPLDTRPSVIDWILNQRPAPETESGELIDPEQLRLAVEQFRGELEKFRLRAETIRADDLSNLDLYVALLKTYRTGIAAYNVAIVRPVIQKRDYSCRYDETNPAVFCVDIPGGSKIFNFEIKIEKRLLNLLFSEKPDSRSYSAQEREGIRKQLEAFNAEIERLRRAAEEGYRMSNLDLYRQIILTCKISYALYKDAIRTVVLTPYPTF